MPQKTDVCSPSDRKRKERVEERVRFLCHLTYYVGLNLLFFLLDYFLCGRLSWSPYVAGAWGIFIYLHFMSAFVVADLQGPFRRWLLRREREHSEGPDEG